MARTAKRVALLAVGWLAMSGTARALPYIETGDAGDRTSPQATTGTGSLTDIHGSIDATLDVVDAFLFGFAGGGVLEISASLDGTPDLLNVALINGAGADVASGFGSLSASGLAAGSYVVQVDVPEDPHGNDPPYTILLSGPGISFAVPEPGALLLVALAAAACARRRF